jgi:hypothetical protein
MDIDTWFREWRGATENILNACRAAIWRFDSEGPIRIAATFVSVAKAGNVSGVNQEPIFEMLKSASDVAGQARNKCEEVQVSTSIPKRDDFGSYLGPFGLMSFWLLRTESPALVMITGLLGFGLFGAGCSTFIRYRRRHDLSSLAGEDIGGVVIRGASAAVVVFLAVYGGLAVFVATTTAPEPNAYAVFFTCLVAAVFSEEAWNWAHKRFPLNAADRPQSRSNHSVHGAPNRDKNFRPDNTSAVPIPPK